MNNNGYPNGRSRQNVQQVFRPTNNMNQRSSQREGFSRGTPLQFFITERFAPALFFTIIFTTVCPFFNVGLRMIVAFLFFLLLTFPRRRSEFFALCKLIAIGLWEGFKRIFGIKPYIMKDRPSYQIGEDGQKTWYEYRIYSNIWQAWFYARLLSYMRKPIHHPPHAPGMRFHFHSYNHDTVTTERGETNIHFLYGDEITDESLFEPGDREGQFRLKKDSGLWPFMPRLFFDL